MNFSMPTFDLCLSLLTGHAKRFPSGYTCYQHPKAITPIIHPYFFIGACIFLLWTSLLSTWSGHHGPEHMERILKADIATLQAKVTILRTRSQRSHLDTLWKDITQECDSKYFTITRRSFPEPVKTSITDFATEQKLCFCNLAVLSNFFPLRFDSYS